MNYIFEEIQNNLNEIKAKMDEAIERKNNGEEIDYYEDYNKYFFMLQNIRKEIKETLNERN